MGLIEADADRALELLLESLEHKSAIDVQHSRLHTLALAHLARGDVDDADRLLVESLKHAVAIAQDEGVAYSLAGLAALARADGDDRRAASPLASAEAFFARAGAHPSPYEAQLARETGAAARTRLGEERFGNAWQEGLGLSPAEAIAWGFDRIRPAAREAGGA